MTTFLHVCAAAYQVYRQKAEQKYPTWEGMENYQQHDVIKREFKEVDDAYLSGNVHGDHWQIDKLLCLVVVSVLRIIELTRRAQ